MAPSLSRFLILWCFLGIALMPRMSNAQSAYPAAGPIESEMAERFKQAEAYLRSNEPAAALEVLSEELEKEPLLPPQSLVRMDLFGHLSHVLSDLGANSLATEQALLSLQAVNAISTTPSSPLYRATQRAATCLLEEKQMDSAQQYYLKAAQIADALEQNIDPEIAFWRAEAQNDLGIFYLQTGQLDSAEFHLDQASLLLPASTKISNYLRHEIELNKSLVKYKSGDYEKSISNYLTIYNQSRSERSIPAQIQSGMGMANIQLELNRPEAAYSVLQEIKLLQKQNKVRDPEKYAPEINGLWQRYFEALGNFPRANEYAKERIRLADSTARAASALQQKNLGALTVYLLAKTNWEKKKAGGSGEVTEEAYQDLKKMTRNIRLLAIFLAISAFIAIMLLFVVFRRRNTFQENKTQLHAVQKRLAESELRHKKVEGEQLRTELDLKKKDLTDLAIDISRKRDWSQEVMDQLKELSTKHTGPIKQDLKSMIIHLRGQLQVDEKMEIFQENIEQVNREFYAQLSSDFPDLTKSEKELCGLIRLNLSNKEISSLRNISPKSVKMGRYRLRKKLNLNPEEDIYDFLQKI